MNLLHFITISNNKLGVGFENKLVPFLTHDGSKSSLKVPIETRRPHFMVFQILS
jgi:hypothetical protein